MTDYRYVFADLRTDASLAELELGGVHYGQKLNQAGSARGTIFLGDPRYSKQPVVTATQPGRTALWIERDGVLVWGGIVWARRYSSTSKQLEISAMEFVSYLDRRLLNSSYYPGSIDQLAVQRALINTYTTISAGSPSDIGIIVGSETSGVNINPTWYWYERRKIGDLTRELAKSATGFDFAIDVAYSGSTRQKLFHIGYPFRGRRAINTGLVFELDTQIMSYQMQDDATGMANSIKAVGAGEGDTMLFTVAVNASQLDNGYPLLEDIITNKDIRDGPRLQTLAQAAVNVRSQGSAIYTPILVGSQQPSIGSWITGDECELRITDELYPNGTRVIRRIVGWDCAVSDVAGPDQTTLILSDPIPS